MEVIDDKRETGKENSRTRNSELSNFLTCSYFWAEVLILDRMPLGVLGVEVWALGRLSVLGVEVWALASFSALHVEVWALAQLSDLGVEVCALAKLSNKRSTSTTLFTDWLEEEDVGRLEEEDLGRMKEEEVVWVPQEDMGIHPPKEDPGTPVEEDMQTPVKEVWPSGITSGLFGKGE